MTDSSLGERKQRADRVGEACLCQDAGLQCGPYLAQGADLSPHLGAQRMRSAVRFFAVAAASLVVACANGGLPASKALAENYPDHVVKIINPFPPGGSVDVTARLLAQRLSEGGHQFIVETRS